MKTGLFLRYAAVMVLVFLGWWFYRYVSPALMTLIALVIMAGSTLWFLVAVAREPEAMAGKTRSWWRMVWDGFWGL